MNLQEALREALLFYRGKNNYSQEKMADLSNISVRYYRKIEAGAGNPSLKILANFRSAFGIDINQLVDSCNGFTTESEE